MRYLLIILVLFLSGCIHLTPKQEAVKLAIIGKSDVTWISSEEIKEMLPKAAIKPGIYKLTPRGIMPRAEWCNPFLSSNIFEPKGWDCKDYTYWALDSLNGYACGSIIRQGNPKHMQVICIDEDWKIIIYEPQTCQWDFVPSAAVVYITIE